MSLQTPSYYADNVFPEGYGPVDMKMAYAIAQAAALVHDLGKSVTAWQSRLKKGAYEKKDKASFLVRHEVVSTYIFLKFYKDYGHIRLDEIPASEHRSFLDLGRGFGDDAIFFGNIPRIVKAIAYVVATHHVLPTLLRGGNGPCSNEANFYNTDRGFFSQQFLNNGLKAITEADIRKEWSSIPPDKASYVINPKNFPMFDPAYAQAWRNLDLDLSGDRDAVVTRYAHVSDMTLCMARALMISADHVVSSRPEFNASELAGDDYRLCRSDRLYANTDANGKLKQPLLWHLLAVSQAVRKPEDTHNGNLCLPEMPHPVTSSVPDATSAPPIEATDRFAWQQTAFDGAMSIKADAVDGAFCVCTASTGTGKTIGTYRVLRGMSENLRMCYAVGLRSLTAQTAASYRARLNLDKNDVALIMGRSRNSLAGGSESASDDCACDESLLRAPVVACTIDQLMPSTESVRGGKHVEPLLRLKGSDVILDEIDDYGVTDLPAIARLVNLIGRLKRKVIIASATLPPDLTRLLYNAYMSGQRQSGVSKTPYMLFDEFETFTSCATGDGESSQSEGSQFDQDYDAFIKRKIERLRSRISGEIVKFGDADTTKPIDHMSFPDACALMSDRILDAVKMQHARHNEAFSCSALNADDYRVSVGLVRIANVMTLFPVVEAMFNACALKDASEDTPVLHILPYHASMMRSQRNAVEQIIDQVMNRSLQADGGNRSSSYISEITKGIKKAEDRKHHAFIVVASPVCETGRDIDADYAITELSSVKSLIQLAGRVMRHRENTSAAPRISILEYPMRALVKSYNGCAYRHPGPESKAFMLEEHSAATCLRDEEYQVITSACRIQKHVDKGEDGCGEASVSSSEGRYRYLSDLEHASIQKVCIPARDHQTQNSYCGPYMAYIRTERPQTLTTGYLSAKQPFRYNEDRTVQIAFNGADFYEMTENGRDKVKSCRVSHAYIAEVECGGQRCFLWDVPYTLDRNIINEMAGVSGGDKDRFVFHRNLGFAKARKPQGQ